MMTTAKNSVPATNDGYMGIMISLACVNISVIHTLKSNRVLHKLNEALKIRHQLNFAPLHFCDSISKKFT